MESLASFHHPFWRRIEGQFPVCYLSAQAEGPLCAVKYGLTFGRIKIRESEFDGVVAYVFGPILLDQCPS